MDATQTRTKGARKLWPYIKKRVYPNGVVAWMVDARTKEGGARKHFTTRVEAETFAQQQRTKRLNEGAAAFAMAAEDRIDAEAALRILRPHGFTLMDAARFLLKHAPVVKAARPLTDVVEELLASKQRDGASARYLKDLRTRLSIFVRAFPDAQITEFSTAQIDDWLRNLDVGPTTRNNHRRILGVLFSFACQRGYALGNPAKEASKAKEVDKPPGILSPLQAEYLLRAAPSEILPALAIGLFAGLRPESEVWRLDWSSVDLTTGLIDVAADKTKTAQRRFVRISENLAAWLKPHSKKAGHVSPHSEKYFKLLHEARETASALALSEEVPEGVIEEWPPDCLRHTFASMHLAYFKNAGETAQELGHADLKMLYRHYRERVKPADAESFWKILPSSDDESAPDGGTT